LSTVPLPPDYYDLPQPPRRRNWKRIAAWILGGLMVLIAALLIGVVALLHNNGFRQYVLRIAHTKLSEAMGVDLKMRDFSVHLSGLSPSVDMYDVVVDGAAPYKTPPVLQADHLSVGVQIVSLLTRKWYLKDIVVDHPVAHVYVGANGESNLPTPKSSGPGTSVFDLGIRHVMLGQGEVYYNDRQSRLDADLHDFEFQSTFDPAAKKYAGGLGYKDGKIHFQNLNPMVHSFEAEFEATPDTFTLKRSTLTSGASQFSLAATLNDYARPKITATYQSSLDTGELRQILKDATLPVGVVKLAGSAAFESVPNKPVIQSVRLDGNMTSDRLQIHTTTINTLVRDVSARYRLQNGDVDVQGMRAGVLGGGLDGSFKMHDVTGAQISELHASLRNVALASVQALVNVKGMKDLRLTGTANATVDAGWRKTFDTLVAKTDADFKGTVTRTASAAGSPQSPLLPEEGNVHAKYSAAAQEVSFDRSYIRMPQTTVNLNGTVSKTAALQVQVQSNDLSEVETAAEVFGANLQPLGLGGGATFNGTVRGSTTNPQIAGQVSAASLKVKGTEWRTVRIAIDANPSHVALRNGEVVPASNQGRANFNLNLGLDHWTFREDSPFQLDLNAAQLNIADLKNLAGVKAPVTGTLSANISLQGSETSPMGSGHITLTQATVSDEPIQSANIDFQGNGDELKTKLNLRVPAGSAQANVTYFPKRKAYESQLQTTGFRLDQLRTLRAKNPGLTGILNLNAQGSGTVDDPQVRLTAEIPQLRIQDQQINALKLQADVSNHVANVSLDSQSQALNTFIRGHGRVNLTGLYDAEATVDTASIPLQPLFAAYLPAQSNNLTGQTELHATLRGPLKDKARLDAHITIPTLALSYRNNNVQLSAAQPIKLDYDGGVLRLQKTEIRGTKTDLQLQGTIPVVGTAPMTIMALGTIDLSLAQMLDPDITSSGEIQFDIDGTGRRANPDVQGQIKIVNAAFAGDDLPIGLQNGNGVLVLTNDRLSIQQFQGNISGGTMTATGAITYRPSMQFNVALNGTGIRTLFPDGVREGISTNLSLVGTPNYALLRGQVRLTEVSFSPAFDVGNILGAVGGTPGSAAPPSGFAQNLHLNVNVVSTSDLNLSSTQLSLQGAANLRIGGTAGQPSVLGRVNLTGGDLIFRGNRYLLQPSTLDFVDPYRIEPRVNLAVDTTVKDYNVHMLFRGTVDRLRTTYTSEPALPPSDIINLLVFGKTGGEQAAEQAANTTPGTLGAESMIASSVSSEVTGRVEKIAGISQLSVDPVLGGNGQDPGARVTVQQRVTGNLFVTFATDATSTQRQVIKLEYQATPRVAVSGVRDQNGGFALDVRIKKTW
jgi:translocation and assembly module TamB